MNLNNLAFVVIIATYILVLTILLFIISPRYDKVILPDYDHNEYAEKINPRVMVVGDSDLVDGEIKTEYDIYLRLEGRLVDGADPRYTIKRMQMSALTTKNRLHYFTEYNDFETPRTHGFLPIKDGAPEQFFIKLEYLDNNNTETITFREDMMLDLTDRSKYSQYNKIVHEENGEVVEDLVLQVIATKKEKDYETSMRMLVRDFSKKYHIDMQSWIVTEDGKVLPYVGVYGQSDPRSSFTDSNRLIPLNIKPKTIFVKVKYIVDGKTQTILYQNEFANLTEKYSEIPDVEAPGPSGLNNWQVMLIIAGGTLAVIGITGIVYTQVKKKKESKRNKKKSR